MASQANNSVASMTEPSGTVEAVELLPCPFCGEHAAVAETRAAGHTFYGVDCMGCGAQVHESDPQRAVMLWNNRRATPSDQETWESINQWCDDKFGPATIPKIIKRAKEEFDELEEDGANHAIEAADVVICLCRIPGFAEALQEKMAINRKRQWRLTGDGTGYHIPERNPT